MIGLRRGLFLELCVATGEHLAPVLYDLIVARGVVQRRFVVCIRVGCQQRLEYLPVFQRLPLHRVVRRGRFGGSVVPDTGGLPPLSQQPTDRVLRNIRDCLLCPPRQGVRRDL